jgi:cell division protein FtsZ
MVFITAGMGGGTGTGAAPVIARMAREKNILTVGVVTKPFTFEGQRRARAADDGIAELQQYVDTLIVIPNQNLFRLANERTGWKEAFKMADNVLYMGVRGVTDLMVAPGLVNLDFADIRTVMAEMGKAMMGTGEADGDNRAVRAAEAAISNPLLEDTSMAGARGLLINITGGDDMTLFEVDQAANRIREEVDDEANIIFGSAIDETLTGKIRVSVVATGIDTPSQRTAERPKLVAVGSAPATVSMAAGANGAPLGIMAAPPPGSRGMGPVQARLHHPSRPLPATPSGLTQASASGSLGGPVGARMVHGANALQAAPVGAHAEPEALADHQAHGYAEDFADPHTAVHAPQRTGGYGASHGFSEAAEPAPQPPRRSLFGIVTGAIRGTLPATPYAPPAPPAGRAEPQLQEAPREASRAKVHPAASEEMGIDIPAFLRRQSS